MSAPIRNILALALGVLIGGMINMAIVTFGPSVIPPPAGVDVTDIDSISANLDRFEAKHFVSPFLAHAFGTFVGSLVAFMVAVSHRRSLAFVIGFITLAGGIAAATMIPAPVWFVLLDLVVAYLPMAWLACLVGEKLVSGNSSAADSGPA